MMMDCFFSSGADFDLVNNGEFVCDDMTDIPSDICEEYGLRLIMASVNYEGHFDIDGECIGTLGECFTIRGVNTRFGVRVVSVDGEFSLSIDDSRAFHSISLNIPPHVTSAELNAIRDELRDIVVMQRLKQPSCCTQ